MISDKYFCSDNALISPSNVACAAADIPVRMRLMKAVFFFKDESKVPATSNRSCAMLVLLLRLVIGLFTLCACPDAQVYVPQFACGTESASYSRHVENL